MYALILQQFPHKLQGCPFIPAFLNQDVKYFAFAIHGAPQVHLFTADVYENFVEVPDVECRVTAFANSAGISLSEFQYPQTNRLIGDVDPSLREKILNIPVAHRETKIEPNGLSNYVGVEAVAAIRDFLHR